MTPETTGLLTQPLPNGLSTVEQEIARACIEARRDRASVTLIAVSKTFDAAAISPIIDAGQRVFGENRVQEAKAKWPGLMSDHSGIALHLIGPLQSNKAREAVALFDAIHSVDRASICEALAKEINSQKRQPELFVQLNTGEEPQKAGVAPGEADAFIAVDGHERRFRDRDPDGRHACARRIGDLRASLIVVPANAGTHSRRCFLLEETSRRVLSPRPHMGPGVRRDDVVRDYSNPTDTFPSTPKSAAKTSPD